MTIKQLSTASKESHSDLDLEESRADNVKIEDMKESDIAEGIQNVADKTQEVSEADSRENCTKATELRELEDTVACNIDQSVKSEDEASEDVGSGEVVDSTNESNRESQQISVKKLEDLIPPSTEYPVSIDSIKEEGNSSDTTEPYIPPREKPKQKVGDKQQCSQDATTTPRKKKKRNSSVCSDFDQLSDVVKPDSINFNDYEVTELLHDLEDVIDFEDVKISSQVLLSSMTCENILCDSQTSESEMSKDTMDPLYIESDNETTAMAGNKSLLSRSEKRSSKRRSTRRKTSISTDEFDANHTFEDISLINIKNTEKELQCFKLNDGVSARMRDKLYRLTVKLIHDVPPQHKIEISGSRAPSQKQKKLFSKYGPIRKGAYTPAEDNIIRNNWTKFCELHDWDSAYVEPFCNLRYKKKFYICDAKERQKFVQFLANGLPWRTLFSVYQRFRILYGKRKRNSGRFSPEEDEKILIYMQKRSMKDTRCKSFSKIAEMLGRTKHSVWSRYKLLTNNHKPIKTEDSPQFTWNLALVKQFIDTLLEVTKSKDIYELKDAVLPKQIWLTMQEKLNINYAALKHLWQHQLHMQLFCPEPIFLNDIKIKLIEYMYAKGISELREIIWPNVSKYFDGMTSIFLSRIFFRLLADYYKTPIPLPDMIKDLHHKKISEIRNSKTDKLLPRIKYVDDGEIQILDHDIYKLEEHSKSLNKDTN